MERPAKTTVYVSFDDGDHWQSLRLNLPSTSIRDMVFHTDHNMNESNGWKAMLATDVTGFNTLLTNNKLPPLKIAPSSVTVPASCTFVSSGGTTRGKK